MAKAKRVYVVEVRALAIPHDHRISQVAYSTYDAAASFILGRADKPEWITKYCLKSDEYDYIIHDLTLAN